MITKMKSIFVRGFNTRSGSGFQSDNNLFGVGSTQDLALDFNLKIIYFLNQYKAIENRQRGMLPVQLQLTE